MEDDRKTGDPCRISLKLARIEMEEQLIHDPGFVVMGENTETNRLIVYSRWTIRGLPIAYKEYGIDQISIHDVRHTIEAQKRYERRQENQG